MHIKQRFALLCTSRCPILPKGCQKHECVFLLLLGVRQEQDIYVRLIDSVTKQVKIKSFDQFPTSSPKKSQFSSLRVFFERRIRSQLFPLKFQLSIRVARVLSNLLSRLLISRSKALYEIESRVLFYFCRLTQNQTLIGQLKNWKLYSK